MLSSSCKQHHTVLVRPECAQRCLLPPTNQDLSFRFVFGIKDKSSLPAQVIALRKFATPISLLHHHASLQPLSHFCPSRNSADQPSRTNRSAAPFFLFHLLNTAIRPPPVPPFY